MVQYLQTNIMKKSRRFIRFGFVHPPRIAEKTVRYLKLKIEKRIMETPNEKKKQNHLAQ